MEHSLDLPRFFLGAVVVSVLALVALTIGLTLLLGTVSHRKVVLPVVWISTATLAAAVTALVLILSH